MSMPMISVIVPVYNTAKFLHRCIDSLINQTYKKTEIVLVDDGSKDDSLQICNEYASKHTNIVVFHKENAGQGLARNDGIKLSHGDYICFLDSDDYYEPDTCELLVKTMTENDADLCSYGYKIEDADGNVVAIPKIKDRVYIGNKVKDDFILHYFGDSLKDDNLRGVSSCMSVFKKGLIVEHAIDFPSERIVSSEDSAFCLEYCKHVNKVVTISKPLYHYVQNSNSFCQSYRDDRLELLISLQEMLTAYSQEYDNFDKVKSRIAMTAWIDLITCFKQEYRNKNKKECIAKFRYYSENCTVKKALAALPLSELAPKQQVLLIALKCRLYNIVYLLVGLRSKKAL